MFFDTTGKPTKLKRLTRELAFQTQRLFVGLLGLDERLANCLDCVFCKEFFCKKKFQTGFSQILNLS